MKYFEEAVLEWMRTSKEGKSIIDKYGEREKSEREKENWTQWATDVLDIYRLFNSKNSMGIIISCGKAERFDFIIKHLCKEGLLPHYIEDMLESGIESIRWNTR